MLNAVIKRLSICAIAAGVISCGGSSGSSGAEADNLLKQAKEQYEAGNYAMAVTLLDSLEASCKDAVDIRREAMKLRPKVMVDKLTDDLAATDRTLDSLQQAGMELRSGMAHVIVDDFDYYVASEVSDVSPRDAAGLYAKASPDFTFYAISSCDKPIKSIAVTASADGQSVRTPRVDYDGERNDRTGRCETITFTESECDSIAQFVSGHVDSDITLTFSGNGEHSMTMPEKQKQAFAKTYRWVSAIRRHKRLMLEREKLQLQLETAYGQIEKVDK